jgi:hypothetical protein
MDEDETPGAGADTEAPAVVETPAAEPAPVEAAPEKDEAAELRAEVARLTAAAKKSEQAAMTEKERADAILKDKAEALDKRERTVAFKEAGIGDLADLISIPEGQDATKVAKALSKIVDKRAAAQNAAKGASPPISPSGGTGNQEGTKLKSLQNKTAHQDSPRWARKVG